MSTLKLLLAFAEAQRRELCFHKCCTRVIRHPGESDHVKVESLPCLSDCGDVLLDGQLLGGVHRHFSNELNMLIKAQLQDAVEREAVGSGVKACLDRFHEVLPVAWPHRWVAEVCNERHRLLEGIDAILDPSPHFPVLDITAQLQHAFAYPYCSLLQLLHLRLARHVASWIEQIASVP